MKNIKGKSFTFIILMCLHISAAKAEVNTRADVDNFCSQIYDMAKLIMELRQQELPMTKMMAMMNDGMADQPEFAQEIARQIVMDAYELLPYIGADAQEKGSKAFANRKSSECYRRYGN